MKRSGSLEYQFTAYITADLKKRLDSFAKEFAIKPAEAARFALYELVDTFEENRESMQFYDAMYCRLQKMWDRDAQTMFAEIEQENINTLKLRRLKKAWKEGLIKKNYAALPQTTSVVNESSFIHGLIQELDAEKIDREAFRRRIRHYVFNRLINVHNGGDSISTEEMEKQLEKELEKII